MATANQYPIIYRASVDQVIGMSFNQFKELFQNYDRIEISLDESAYGRDKLIITLDVGAYAKIGYVECYTVLYGEHFIDDICEGEPPTDGWMVSGVDSYPTDQLDRAVNSFMARLKSEHPSKAVNDGMNVDQIKEYCQKNNIPYLRK